MRSKLDLSIVIVNYNTKQFTAQCLDSIYSNPPDCRYEIVVVDNASTDDSADWLEDLYPGVNLVHSQENRGIAGGNNLGIRASTGRYVLLLNNDTLVLPEMIDRVISFMDGHPEAGGVGGQLLNEDGSFQSGFFEFPTLFQQFLIVTKIGQLIRPYYPSRPPVSEILQVDWMSTAFMLFRREALEFVGLVDEEFFIYSDESDLQYRLKEAGWPLYYHPDVQTIHFGGRSLTPWRRRNMVYRGYLLFFEKHYGYLEALLLRGLFLLVSALKIPIWGMATLWPDNRDRSKHELASNLAILRMCVRRGIIPPG